MRPSNSKEKSKGTDIFPVITRYNVMHRRVLMKNSEAEISIHEKRHQVSPMNLRDRKAVISWSRTERLMTTPKGSEHITSVFVKCEAHLEAETMTRCRPMSAVHSGRSRY